jgi:hypothetical protein
MLVCAAGLAGCSKAEEAAGAAASLSPMGGNTVVINNDPPMTVTVSATSTKTVEPDMAEITFGVVTEGDNAADAQEKNTKDVDAVIETKRGHNLGRVLWTGNAAPNTGIPGIIGGYGKERVIHCPATGILRNIKKITDTVSKGDTIALVETADGSVPVKATLDDILRGLIRDGYPVTVGFKMADIDPRTEELGNCFTISDKARCIAGGVLEAILQRKGELGL